MATSKEEVAIAYQKYARNYDFAVKLYSLIGLHLADYRARAVDHLHLKQGDSVLDLGCGTGLNFPLLIERIGNRGHLIGVDFSSEMLACADERVKRFNWKNVDLIHSDITNFQITNDLNGVLATGVFGYLDECDRIIEAISHALVPGGRFAIVDGKHPSKWPAWLFHLFVWLSSPFGLTEEYFSGHTWESVERYLEYTTFEEVYGGMMYISSGCLPHT